MMTDLQTEQMLYVYEHSAINTPTRFLQEYPPKQKIIPTYVMQLLKAKAIAAAGNVMEAIALLHETKQSFHNANIPLFLGKYYLSLYYLIVYAYENPKQGNEYYDLALKFSNLSGSKALLAEAAMMQSLRISNDISLDAKEELLQQAMENAIASQIPDIPLQVYLGYAILYLNHNMFEPANRELLLLQDVLSLDQNPALYIQMLNYLGIVLRMNKNLEVAKNTLEQGINIAKDRGLILNLVPLQINMGLCLVNADKVSEGIAVYQESLDLMQESGLSASPNANKVHDNLARAYAKAGDMTKAIALLRENYELNKKNGNTLREHIVNVNLSDHIIEIGLYQEAESRLDEAIAYFQEGKHYLYLTSACRCKARLYEVMEDYKKGFEALEMLDYFNRMHFNENFSQQDAKHKKQLERIKTEYLVVKNLCQEQDRINRLSKTVELIGEHPSVKQAIKDAMMAAKHPNVNVLVTGESGTGKEIIARLIHNESNTGKALVAVNASAIAPQLIESELFGHKKGAFTGAMEDRKGKFLMADKGTLLLDEIADMPVDAQVKLLRAIESKTIQPVGSDKDIPVTCRIISTSNCSLLEHIRLNKFRLDLYHRLNKVEIHLLPLRERKSDLEILVQHFLNRFSHEFLVPKPFIHDSFYDRLSNYSFPGNIRELMNIMERIFILKPKSTWSDELLDDLIFLPENLPKANDINQNMKNAEYQMIFDALNKTLWIQKDAASLLNMPQSTLSRRIKALGIRK